MPSQSPNQNRGSEQHAPAQLAGGLVTEKVEHQSPAYDIEQRKKAVQPLREPYTLHRNILVDWRRTAYLRSDATLGESRHGSRECFHAMRIGQ